MTFYSILQHYENNLRMQDIIERIGIPQFLLNLDNFKNKEDKLNLEYNENIIQKYVLLKRQYHHNTLQQDIEDAKNRTLKSFKNLRDLHYQTIKQQHTDIKTYIISIENIFNAGITEEEVATRISTQQRYFRSHISNFRIPPIEKYFEDIRKLVDTYYERDKGQIEYLNARRLIDERYNAQILNPERRRIIYSNSNISCSLKDNIDINKLRIEIKKDKASTIKYKSIIQQEELIKLEKNDDLVKCLICYEIKNFYFEQNEPTAINEYLQKLEECENDEEREFKYELEPIVICNCGHTYHLTCYNKQRKNLLNNCVKCQNEIKSAVILRLK